MRQKKLKNKCLLWVCTVVFASLFVTMYSTAESYAYNFSDPTVFGPGNSICPDTAGFTARIVTCIKESILYGVNAFISPFADALSDFINAACLMALIVWGGLMAVGKRSAPIRDASVMLIKIGAVIYTTNNYTAIFSVLLDMMEYLLDTVTAYLAYSPSFECPLLTSPGASIGIWQRVDCTIEFLIGGIVSPFNIFFGITGFLIAALFSQSVGLFFGLIGLLIIGQLLWAVVRCVYIFLSAYIAFALMAVISPLFIPLILFQGTKGYFEKWLRITMGFMLQPIFLFTYLAMLMAAYDVVVYTGPNALYRIIAGPDVNDPNFKLGEWVYTNGVYGESSQSGQAYNVNPVKTLDLVQQDTNVGIMGTTQNPADLNVKLTEQLTSSDPNAEYNAWFQNNGLPRDIISNNLNLLDYFRVDLPVKAIDWENLAAIHGYPPDDIVSFWVDLLLSAIMALLITYIFLLMLDLLPFIGSGVAGDVLSTPAFGTGPFAPPGDGAVSGIKNKMMGNLMGGRGGLS